jgi:hypothetical protein
MSDGSDAAQRNDGSYGGGTIMGTILHLLNFNS